MKCKKCGTENLSIDYLCKSCNALLEGRDAGSKIRNEIIENKISEEKGICSKKKCPFCAEDIQNAAIKCRYCGEMLNNNNKSKETTNLEDKGNVITGSMIAGAMVGFLTGFGGCFMSQESMRYGDGANSAIAPGIVMSIIGAIVGYFIAAVRK